MATIRLTWLGHASVLIEDGAGILTDPLLTGNLMHLRRRAGPLPNPVPLHVDAVAISHLHADHLHLPSLAKISPRTPILIPRGGAPILRGLDLDVVEVAAGDVVDVAQARIHVVPAVHADQRWPFSAVHADPVGYVVAGAGTTYFAGDTSAFPGMRDLHRVLPGSGPDGIGVDGTGSPAQLDVALLPVGGWGPWLRGEHMDPADAASCLPLLEPRVAIPIHYGTFWPRGITWLRPQVFHEPGREFAKRVTEIGPGVEVRVLDPGGATEVAVHGRPDAEEAG